MTPDNHKGWNIERLLEIRARGVFENDQFELKAILTTGDQVKRGVAAFANTRGGVLIYGVSDDRQLLGIEKMDFAREFANRIARSIEPAPDYQVLDPIPIANERYVYVVEIPRSQRVPHAVLVDERWVFLKRTAGGTNIPMSYEEIRLAFQDTETRRTKLALVASELALIKQMAERIRKDIPEDTIGYRIFDWAWSSRYPTNLLDHLLGEAYSILAKHQELWALLNSIRDAVRTANTYGEALATMKFQSALNTTLEQRAIQAEIRQRAIGLSEASEQALNGIAGVLALEV